MKAYSRATAAPGRKTEPIVQSADLPAIDEAAQKRVPHDVERIVSRKDTDLFPFEEQQLAIASLGLLVHSAHIYLQVEQRRRTLHVASEFRSAQHGAHHDFPTQTILQTKTVHLFFCAESVLLAIYNGSIHSLEKYTIVGN